MIMPHVFALEVVVIRPNYHPAKEISQNTKSSFHTAFYSLQGKLRVAKKMLGKGFSKIEVTA